MRSVGVIVPAPGAELRTGIFDRSEPLHVQAFIPQPSVGSGLLEISKYSSTDSLLFSIPVEVFRDAVAFRLLNESEAGLDGPEPDLVQKVVPQLLATIIQLQKAGASREEAARQVALRGTRASHIAAPGGLAAWPRVARRLIMHRSRLLLPRRRRPSPPPASSRQLTVPSSMDMSCR